MNSLGDDINDLPWKRQLGDVSVLDITEKFPGQGERVVLQKLVAVGCEDCITLSVLSAPLKLTGTFTRLLNPFIR